MADFPIIDISQIDSPVSQLAIAREITAAAQKWGFLLLKNHPITPGHIARMFSLSKDFFTLPETQKEPYPITSRSNGYIGSFKDRNKDDKMSMWFGGAPGSLSTNRAELPPFWHEHIEEVEAFKRECHAVVLKLLVCFALALGLPDRNYFADAHRTSPQFGNNFRMLHYPARNERPPGTRMNQHTDSGSVTLLFQQSPGLDVLSPSGEWVRAPCIPGTILINLGDALSYWSGGVLKATPHKVTFDGLPFDVERQSMAYFGTARPETVLEPIDKGKKVEMYTGNGVQLVPGMTVGEYNRKIMMSIYASVEDEKDVKAMETEKVVGGKEVSAAA